MPPTPADIAAMIDHALLSPTLTQEQLEAGIAEARGLGVASVCILPYYLRRCAERLAGSGVRPSTVIAFPHGGASGQAKLAEARQALADGGAELDMVVNISAVVSGDWARVEREIAAVASATHDAGAALKVIFENCYLTDAQKVALCDICGRLGVNWVKTSTGFGPGGATLADLELMRRHSPAPVQVKASGGIRDLDFILEARRIGVSRIGLSRTAEILAQARQRLGS